MWETGGTMSQEFILCDAYLVKKGNERRKRLFGIMSFNQYGSQGKDKYTFHVLGTNGIETISGADGILMPLKGYQKNVYRSAFLGGTLGFILSLLVRFIPFI
jgi:hypothetical protein